VLFWADTLEHTRPEREVGSLLAPQSWQQSWLALFAPAPQSCLLGANENKHFYARMAAVKPDPMWHARDKN
jgi:hypothetical protein